MEEETDVEAVYGQRDALPFDVRLVHDLSTDELTDLLAEHHDFLHYIGHAEPDGLVCEDGKLDCAGLDGTGVDTFFLNACRSYRQARALIEAGAIVGVGSHTDVTNASAVGLGRTMARLLEYGFPFRPALDIARDHHPVGEQYIVIGDGSLSVVQCNAGTALFWEAERLDEDRIAMTVTGYPTPTHGLGGEFMPFVNQAENTYYISSGEIDTFELSTAEVTDLFQLGSPPVHTPDGLVWADSFDPESL